MAGFTTYLFVYVLGGLTFLPLVVLAVLLHAYLVFPVRSVEDDEALSTADRDARSEKPGSDEEILKSGTGGLLEKFNARTHEADVAAGYFAVCREYVPGGVNGKPPERITPAGAVIASESPSVYQSMYRSIFDRKQPPTLEAGKNGKKATNVFFVVLRLGHLMLYLDSEQVTLRHVFSLAHYDVGLHDGKDHKIPEGELWIRRNAICLTRKAHLRETNPDGTASHQLFLFSENCSEKEDFYFALLQNQERKPNAPDNAPLPLQYDVKHIVSLVQRLHSSEEQLQTRWINALIGRLFLCLYKTKQTQEVARIKIKKKIARVKKPAFLSDIELRKIDMGEAPPLITNPRLKDLTVDGSCAAEADVKYTGNFRLEIATTARIELGSRIKPREVDLVLAVVFKKLEGHGIIRFKPPPSNRVWISFETMPKIEMSIEPIVSSRQITYGIILRQIENRIREVIAETLVLPHWDDIPFTDTLSEAFRGGIWADEDAPGPSSEKTHESVENVELSKVDEDEKPANIDGADEEPNVGTLRSREKTMSMPAIPASPPLSQKIRKAGVSTQSLADTKDTASTSGFDSKKRSEKPRAVRAGSFAATATPVVSMDSTNVDALKRQKDGSQKDAASSMIEISHRSQPTSPMESPVGSPPHPSTLSEAVGSYSSTSSKESNEEDPSTPQSSGPVSTPLPSSPPTTSGQSSKSLHGFGNESGRTPSVGSSSKSMTSAEKRQSIASLGNAAKKWGWGVINKAHERQASLDEVTGLPKEGSKERPIGRGRPIPFAVGKSPPLGPTKATAAAPSVPKRKPLPPPVLPKRRQEVKSRPEDPPAAQEPSASESGTREAGADEDVLVVSAPADSRPTTPLDDGKEDFVHPLDMEDEASDRSDEHQVASSELEGERHPDHEGATTDRPPLPQKHISSSSAASKDVLPSWIAAEDDAGSPKLWIDSENTTLS